MIRLLMPFLLVVSACTAPKQTTTSTPSTPIANDAKLFTALFQQQAAEYKALCFQAYNVARMKLDQYTLGTQAGKKYAIVTDIDETVLDNSPFAVREGLRGNDFEENAWHAWTSRADADTVPGAPTFLKYAAS